MENDRNKNSTDPGQRKWDKAGPEKASGRSGGAEGDSYTEGKEARPSDPGTTSGETRAGDPKIKKAGDGHGTDSSLNDPVKPESANEGGGTPSQGPTTGGMGSAGGGHDTKDGDETDVWGDRGKTK